MAAKTAPPATPADASAPRIELARTMNGAVTWRIVVPADDGSEAAMHAAANVAASTHRHLTGLSDGT
jgi:hypothetical protein